MKTNVKGTLMTSAGRAALAVTAAIGMNLASGNVTPARAADHGDAPGVRLDTRLDINDVYVFRSPTDANNTVLIMTTNPIAGITGPLTYHTTADYDILIDNTGDAKADLSLRLKFRKPDANNVQPFSLFLGKRKGPGNGKRIATGQTGQTSSIQGGGSVTAGNFDDPFFFDLLSFRNGLNFCTATAENFFTGLNTLAIVIEIPSSALVSKNSTNIGVYGRTLDNGKQVDRMGRPAINTVLVKSANKDKFNRADPDKDLATYGPDAKEIITSLGNGANADALVNVLFPDLLTFDTANASGFLNGRKLEDDVIDGELKLLTGNNAASDCVANDSTFRTTFPYLGVKNP